MAKQRLPFIILKWGLGKKNCYHQQGIHNHYHCTHPLQQPITQAVMRTNHDMLYHSRDPIKSVNTMLATSTAVLLARAGPSSMPRCMSSAK